MSISDRLLSLRKSKKLTQKEISQAIGISVMGYQRYEYGTREPTASILIKLADYFNISVDYLLGRTDNPKINK